MNESAMTLAVDWSGQEVEGWLWSEKLDGCRAYWDGERFWTRGGHVIQAPHSITASLPDCHLDGEIWAGRGQFTAARLAVQNNRWTPAVRFVVFDAPAAPGRWSERMRSVSSTPNPRSPVRSIRWGRLHGIHDMNFVACKVVMAGGEGIVMRHPDSEGYQCGRSEHMLRLKPIG